MRQKQCRIILSDSNKGSTQQREPETIRTLCLKLLEKEHSTDVVNQVAG